jgi:6-phosphogluconolactonase
VTLGPVRVVEDAAALAAEGAREFAERAKASIGKQGRFAVALSGGSTPKALYGLLARWSPPLPWQDIHLFWSDERCVPLDHPDSNYRMVKEALIDPGGIPKGSVHRVRTEAGQPAEVAADYERELRAFFRLGEREFPRFDLVLLGMGPDGHTASLFPGTPGLGELRRLVVPAFVERLQSYRVTLTLPALNAAAAVLFLVEGADKAEMLERVIGGGNSYPAGLVKPETGDLLWLVDRAAARLLSPT